MFLFQQIRRFHSSGYLVMLGLAIASFVCLQAADATTRIQREQQAQQPFPYTASIGFGFVAGTTPSDETVNAVFQVVYDAACAATCNSSYAFSLFVKNGVGAFAATACLHSPLGIRLTVANGQPIADWTGAPENALLVGQNLLSLSDSQQGITLPIGTMGDIDAPIYQVLQDDSAAQIDYRIVCDWAHMSEELREMARHSLQNTMLQSVITFADDQPVDAQVAQFQETVLAQCATAGLHMERLSPTYQQENQDGSAYLRALYQPIQWIGIGICVLFAVFTCYAVCALWVRGRTQELAIRKAYGYSQWQLVRLLLRDLLCLALPALLLAFGVQSVSCLLLGELDFFDHWLLWKGVFACAGTIGITLLCVNRSLAAIAAITPVEATKEE